MGLGKVMSGEEILNSYTNNWFNTRCCWHIPNIKDAQEMDCEKRKALMTKGVIGLRQNADNNNDAVSNFDSAINQVVRTQLDVWAIEYGFGRKEDFAEADVRKGQALKHYKNTSEVIVTLNKNMGDRVAGAVSLLEAEKESKIGMNLLTIMQILKMRENLVNQGVIKTELLKYSLSMYKELKQDGYGAVIERFTTELTDINEKVRSGLDKIPAGVLGAQSVKSVLDEKLVEYADFPDPQIALCHSFEKIAEVFCQVNTQVAIKLAELALPIEKKNNIFSVQSN